MDLKALKDRIDSGYVVTQRHPSLPLSIYNYSRQAQFDWYWDDITLNARGLVLSDSGEVVSACLPKFFTLDQLKDMAGSCDFAYRDLNYALNNKFTAYEKLDGSYLSATNYNGELLLATRGSFTSDQALEAYKIYDELYKGYVLNPDYTYIFEVIYPENRVVVDYSGRRDLVLLAVLDKVNGGELDVYDLDAPFTRALRYDHSDLNSLSTLDDGVNEGFVCRFDSGLRVKIKFDTYKELHRIMTNVSTYTIYDLLAMGQSLDPLFAVADDVFYGFIQDTADSLRRQYSYIEDDAKAYFLNRPSSDDRRTQAEYFLKYSNPSILFSMLDGKDYSSHIWKLIKPKYSKAFKTFDDE